MGLLIAQENARWCHTCVWCGIVEREQGRSRGGATGTIASPPFFRDTDETFVDYLVQIKTFYDLQCYQGARKADNKATTVEPLLSGPQLTGRSLYPAGRFYIARMFRVSNSN